MDRQVYCECVVCVASLLCRCVESEVDQVFCECVVWNALCQCVKSWVGRACCGCAVCVSSLLWKRCVALCRVYCVSMSNHEWVKSVVNVLCVCQVYCESVTLCCTQMWQDFCICDGTQRIHNRLDTQHVCQVCGEYVVSRHTYRIRVTLQWVMSHCNGSCHIAMGHVTFQFRRVYYKCAVSRHMGGGGGVMPYFKGAYHISKGHFACECVILHTTQSCVDCTRI